jgi:hypothetical protein
VLLDEHVGRVFERVLRERGHEVIQAKDVFGEETNDADLVRWCSENDTLLVTNNAADFEHLHETNDHAGLLVYRDQSRPDRDPKGSPERSTWYSHSTGRSNSKTNWSTSTSGTTGFTSNLLPGGLGLYDDTVTLGRTRRSQPTSPRAVR